MVFSKPTALGVTDKTDDIDGADAAGVVVERVEIGDDCLLVGCGDVKAVEVRILGHQFHQLAKVADLEVEVDGVDVFGQKLLVEVVEREGVHQRIPDQAVHIFILKWRFHISNNNDNDDSVTS